MSDQPRVLERLAGVSTTSLADAAAGALRILPPTLRPLRTGLRLAGRALTVDAHDDLMAVFEALRQAQPGDALMIVGNDEHAVAGELFATEALRRGVAGIVIDGMCRDSATLAQIDLPVYARGVVPSACPARAEPVTQVPISIGGVEVNPGDLVLGDDDGLIVGTEQEMESALDAAEAIERRELDLRAKIEGGASLFDSVTYDDHLAAIREGRESRLEFL